MPICANCGQENPEVARFSLACGSALAAEAPHKERKIVTVLFADLVGFTSRSVDASFYACRSEALLAPMA